MVTVTFVHDDQDLTWTVFVKGYNSHRDAQEAINSVIVMCRTPVLEVGFRHHVQEVDTGIVQIIPAVTIPTPGSKKPDRRTDPEFLRELAGRLTALPIDFRKDCERLEALAKEYEF